ncbi:MAG: hypothetical protein LJE62_14955 [Silicimonas sp.]|jgi:hypothetical protein|nr:hypothetical protein [Silicimonas sp.]
MNLLSTLPVLLLALVTLWLVWPLLADPISRRRELRSSARPDMRREDLFRSLAAHAGPKHDLFEADRG